MKTYCSDDEGNQVKIKDLEKRTREQKEENKWRARRSGEEEGEKERIDRNLDPRLADNKKKDEDTIKNDDISTNESDRDEETEDQEENLAR
jgi:hypothetical protein